MSRILLDTSAYSAFMRGDVIVTSVVQTAEEICLNPIVLGELICGFIRGKLFIAINIFAMPDYM